jgi:hypothetical protein
MLPMGFGHVDGITHDYKRHAVVAGIGLLALFDLVLAQIARLGLGSIPRSMRGRWVGCSAR